MSQVLNRGQIIKIIAAETLAYTSGCNFGGLLSVIQWKLGMLAMKNCARPEGFIKTLRKTWLESLERGCIQSKKIVLEFTP